MRYVYIRNSKYLKYSRPMTSCHRSKNKDGQAQENKINGKSTSYNMQLYAIVLRTTAYSCSTLDYSQCKDEEEPL